MSATIVDAAGSSSSDPYRLVPCQQRLGYEFRNVSLLLEALTHTSGANTRAASNERLEFLGDSVLGLVTCELVFARFPEAQEGELTKIKSLIVSRKCCAAWMQEYGFAEFVIVGKAFNVQREIPANILSDTLEAIVAAIYLDGGWPAAKAFVLRLILPKFDWLVEQSLAANAKSDLQHHAQKLYGHSPRYCVIDEQGPDHDKCFKISVEINGLRFTPAWGRTKKIAELNAAMNALAELQSRQPPFPSS